MRRRRGRRLLSLLLLIAAAAAVVSVVEGRFYYANLKDRSFLSVNGDAERVGECLRLAGGSSARGSVGSFWFERPVDLRGGFSTTFHFVVRYHQLHVERQRVLDSRRRGGVGRAGSKAGGSSEASATSAASGDKGLLGLVKETLKRTIAVGGGAGAIIGGGASSSVAPEHVIDDAVIANTVIDRVAAKDRGLAQQQKQQQQKQQQQKQQQSPSSLPNKDQNKNQNKNRDQQHNGESTTMTTTTNHTQQQQHQQELRQDAERQGRSHGFAFVVQGVGPNAIGEGGSGVGYASLQNAVAVEFDMSRDATEMDPSLDHLSVHAALGAPVSAYESNMAHVLNHPITPMKINQRYRVQIRYADEKIAVYLGDLVRPVLAVRVGALNGKFWVGFTGAQDAVTNANLTVQSPEVCEWYFDRTPEHDADCDPGFVGHDCVVDNKHVVQQCLARSSCNECVTDRRDCQWCGSKGRCVAGVMEDVQDKQYCPDALTITDEVGCQHVATSIVWVWTLLVCVLVILLIVGFVGKVYLPPETPEATLSSSSSSSFSRRDDVWIPTGQLAASVRFGLEQIEMTREIASVVFSTALGTLFAVFVSFVVNNVLVEISISPTYSIGFGLMFIIIGGIIFWQTVSHHFDWRANRFVGDWSHFLLLLLYALLVVASGVICFLLERDWSHSMSVHSKVPLYAILGVALCFSFVFVVVDLFNRVPNLLIAACADSKFHVLRTPPLVESHMQVRLLACTATISGLYFGYVFGMLDVEDVGRNHIELALQKDNLYCYPLGGLLGGLSALLGHWMSSPSDAAVLELDAYSRRRGRLLDDDL
eukprot:TRINITY_DN65549_c9_g8_i2.p1 TRINITY_DN65549_c9_g8~~TRINITY_DN65549_c9_g8_i2.p1  ORF type:complete len:831 (-),score=336.35 TRINITY_DN65549_c9_g8_i2:26-2476(-)